MTTATNTSTSQAIGASTRTPFAPRTTLSRQITVEARKLVDTRSGFWLIIGGLALTVAVAVLTATLILAALGVDSSQYTLLTATASVGNVVGMLLALLGILTITSEWTQRTALVTFALEPRRGRVLQAKVATLLGATALAVALSVVVGAGIVALTRAMGFATGWDLPAAQFLGFVGQVLFNVLLGVAIGLLLQHGAAAIVAFFVVPMMATMVNSAGGLWEPLGRIAVWVTPDSTLEALGAGTVHGVQWLQLCSVLLLWIVIPSAIGTWRWLRRQIS